jgi:hypothetical protein
MVETITEVEPDRGRTTLNIGSRPSVAKTVLAREGKTMATFGASRLTDSQRVLADRVCLHARTLDLRVRELARAVWTGAATGTDGRAVYGWLVELDLSDQLAGVVILGGGAL